MPSIFSCAALLICIVYLLFKERKFNFHEGHFFLLKFVYFMLYLRNRQISIRLCFIFRSIIHFELTNFLFMV